MIFVGKSAKISNFGSNLAFFRQIFAFFPEYLALFRLVERNSAKLSEKNFVFGPKSRQIGQLLTKFRVFSPNFRVFSGIFRAISLS